MFFNRVWDDECEDLARVEVGGSHRRILLCV